MLHMRGEADTRDLGCEIRDVEFVNSCVAIVRHSVRGATKNGSAREADQLRGAAS